MTDLRDFLLARIDEEEAAATALPGPVWSYSASGVGPTGSHLIMHPVGLELSTHVAKYDPSRVQKECRAKRLILREHHALIGQLVTDGEAPVNKPRCAICSGRVWPCKTVEALSLPYTQHKDFREEWRADA